MHNTPAQIASGIVSRLNMVLSPFEVAARLRRQRHDVRL
jgi:hypothetical protein